MHECFGWCVAAAGRWGPSTNRGTNARMFSATAIEGDASFQVFVVVIRGRLPCPSLLVFSNRDGFFQVRAL